MTKQIIFTTILLSGISTYILFKNEEELSGNSTHIKEQYYEGLKSGEHSKLNTLKWIFNKDYRRGYILGAKNAKF
jgi:hypothetical protein